MQRAGAEWKGTEIVIVVIVVAAAVVALVLFGLIMAKGRPRFYDESERFRYVSDLTSQWSKQRQRSQGAEPGQAAQGAPGEHGGRPEQEAIDLRDHADTERSGHHITAP